MGPARVFHSRAFKARDIMIERSKCFREALAPKFFASVPVLGAGRNKTPMRDHTERARLEEVVLRATEDEQRRIGCDLHDDLCQQLTAIEYLSQSLAGRLSKGFTVAAAARAREIAGLAREAITHTRALAHGLAPIHLEVRNLPEALRQLSRHARKLWGVDSRFHCRGRLSTADSALTIHLYRIAQEALANAVKHGQARRVDTWLRQNKRRLVLAIADDGVGISGKAPARDGMGLHVMEYRAHAVGGTLALRRNRRGGTSVICTIDGKAATARSA